MNKRPLLIMSVCFVLGEILALNLTLGVAVIITAGLSGLMLLYYRSGGGLVVLLVFVVLFALGFVLMKGMNSEDFLAKIGSDDSKYVQVEGTVSSIERSSSGYRIYIKKPVIIYGGDEYILKRKILVSMSSLNTSDTESLTLDLVLGDVVTVTGQISSLAHESTPGGFDQYDYYRARNVDSSLKAETVSYDSDERQKRSFYYKVLEGIRILRLKLTVRISKLFDEDDAGIVEAMLLGDKSDIPEDEKTQYQNAGIAHLIAVSGLHVGLIGVAIYGLLRKFRMRKFPASVIAAVLIIVYGILAGMSGSCVRAIIMLIVAYFGRVIGRNYDMLSAMSLAAIIILMLQPMQLIDAGFQLSFGAVVGIGAVFPAFRKMREKSRAVNKHGDKILVINKLEERISAIKKLQEKIPLVKNYGNSKKIKGGIIDSFLLSASIQIVTIPVICTHYYSLPTYGIFLNLIVIPLMSLLVPTAIAGVLISYVWTGAAQFILICPKLILEIYDKLSAFSLSLKGSMLITGNMPTDYVIIYYALLIVLMAVIYEALERSERLRMQKTADVQPGKREYIRNDSRGNSYKILLIKCLTFLILMVVSGIHISVKCYHSNQQLTVDMLDVGQGDGLSIKFPDGEMMLIDGGSTTKEKLEKYVYSPYLKYMGISKIKYSILTHTDKDHISGIIELLNSGYDIEYIVLPDMNGLEEEENYKSVYEAATANGTEIIRMKTGDVISSGNDITLTCLNPSAGFTTDNVNEASVTLSLQYKNFKMLLTGDLVDQGENAVIEELNTRASIDTSFADYTVLKVPHHGSNLSTYDEFLDAVNPKYAIISAGKNNTYGHPGEELLERLDDRNIERFCTIQSGTIRINTDGNAMSIKQWLLDE